MQITSVNKKHYTPNFGAVYSSNKTFSSVQRKAANAIIEEFKKVLPKAKGRTLEDSFKRRGYDFVIEPVGDEFVSLNAYRGFRLEGAGVDTYATYEKGGYVHVGKYNDKATDSLQSDLQKRL